MKGRSAGDVWLLESAFILPCFGLAFAFTRLIDRFLGRRMSHFARGVLVVAVVPTLMVVAAVIWMLIAFTFGSRQLDL
ncbi:MAG TPA: hypothetical protein VK789_02825 [Bryobacteraceae bacterium]|nr:hypothetical protein [Bryobacteraceae bacterium]